MKKKFFNGFLMVAALLLASTSFVACDDRVEDVYAELHGQLNEQDLTLRDLLEQQIDGLQAELDALEARQKLDSIENNADINALKARLDALEAKKDACDQDGDGKCDHEHDVPTVPACPCDKDGDGKCDHENNTTTVPGCTCDKDGDGNCDHQGSGSTTVVPNCSCDTTNLSFRIDSTLTYINEVNKIAAEALALAKADSARINADSIRIDSAITRIANIEKLMYCWSDTLKIAFEKAASAHLRIDSLRDTVKSEIERLDTLAAQNLRLANAYADTVTNRVAQALKAELADSMAAVNAKLTDLEKAYKAADQELREDLKALTERVDALEKNLDALEGAFNQLITSVLVQGVDSPVFGYAALPINLRSNILAAYYGFAGENGLEFPTARPAYYMDQDAMRLSPEDVEMLGVTPWGVKDGDFLLGAEGNAGTLYLTVNPNTVDFTGVKFELVNSIEEKSGVELSSIAPSDRKLSFGMSRAGNNNGFYEAKATLTYDNVSKVKANIDLDALKGIVRDVTDRKDGVNVTNILTTLVQQMDDVLDANAVKATWTDELGQTRSTYSHYAVAATAVKPLSYAFGKDFNVKKMPGIERAENLIGKLTDRVSEKLSGVIPDLSGLQFKAPKIEKIEIDTLCPDSFKIKFQVDMDTTFNVSYTFSDTINIDDVVIKDMDGKTEVVSVDVPEKTHTVTVARWIYTYEADGVTKKDSTLVNETQEITIPAYKIDVPSTNFTVEGQTVVIKDYVINQELDIPITFSYTYSGEQDVYPIIKDLYGNIVESIEGVNGMLGELDAFMDDVNKMLDELNKLKEISASINGVTDDVKATLTKYLDKFNTKFCNLINSTNKAIQPVMFVKTNDGFSKLSQAKSIPTVLSQGNITLLPTSYTAEIIAPAVKKLVGVTNVYSLNGAKNAQAGDAACKAALDNVNKQTDVAEILEGNVNTIAVTLESGFVYEIAYTAADFDGKVVAQKYYVRVK